MVTSDSESHAIVVKKAGETKIWHQQYGHLHLKGTNLLQKSDVVRGLPLFKSSNVYETCIYRKLRNLFLLENHGEQLIL